MAPNQVWRMIAADQMGPAPEWLHNRIAAGSSDVLRSRCRCDGGGGDGVMTAVVAAAADAVAVALFDL